MLDSDKINEYNSEPVKYCAKCYSLKIKEEEILGFDCCAVCGCSDILETDIDSWEKLHIRRYGKPYVNRNTDKMQSYIFKISIPELKLRFSDNPKWKEYIDSMYPNFPGGYGKVDSIILFFDKLTKDNRLNEFRSLLINNK